MSTSYGAAAGGSGPSQQWASNDWRSGSGRGCGFARWTPVEILATVLGFIVFWPIGLAILAFKFWQRKTGYPGDLQTAAQEKWREARSAFHSGPWAGRAGYGGHSSGNMAFDDWRAAEIARLDEERRKLEEAHREFATFVENIRRAKDREEFERFMNERRARPSQPGPTA
jgi:hypothetical protein